MVASAFVGPPPPGIMPHDASVCGVHGFQKLHVFEQRRNIAEGL
jgi:hypothetical protein